MIIQCEIELVISDTEWKSTCHWDVLRTIWPWLVSWICCELANWYNFVTFHHNFCIGLIVMLFSHHPGDDSSHNSGTWETNIKIVHYLQFLMQSNCMNEWHSLCLYGASYYFRYSNRKHCILPLMMAPLQKTPTNNCIIFIWSLYCQKLEPTFLPLTAVVYLYSNKCKKLSSLKLRVRTTW